MSSIPQKTYYAKHRDVITQRMRERESVKRGIKAKHLEAHPEDMGLEREKMRDKYHNYTSNQCKEQLEEWIQTPDLCEEARAFFTLLTKDDRYMALKPRALVLIGDALNLSADFLLKTYKT